VEVVDFLNEYRSAVVFLCTVAVFLVGAWYGRTVERAEWQRREASRLRHKYGKEVN
jgi:hypothetical protein